MYRSSLLPSRPIIEEVHDVVRFRRFLPDRGNKGWGLVQFYAKEGGMRTVSLGDIVEVR